MLTHSLLLATLLASSSASALRPLLIFGHRGTAGHRPEHTRSSYVLAAEMGADFIEPDLVLTKDGALIARHENDISETTDVAAKFASRKKTKIVDGVTVTGYFTEDFTLKEIKTLRAKERLPFRDHSFDGKDEILTFEEVIALIRDQSRKLKRTIGIIPELKHPTYFRSVGLDPLKPFVQILKSEKLDLVHDVIVQCFELGPLKELHSRIDAPLYFLLDDLKSHPADFVASKDPRTYGDLTNGDSLKEIAKFVTYLGPAKQSLIKADGSSTGLLERAHAAGLKVSPYTFRREKQFVVDAAKGDPAEEYRLFIKLGVDAVFTDFVDDAVKARSSYVSSLEEKH